MNVSLSGSFQVTPNFWADPKTGIPYQMWVQTPEYRNDTLTAITNTPLLISAGTTPGPAALQLLSNVATLSAAASRRSRPTSTLSRPMTFMRRCRIAISAAWKAI